MKWTIVPRGGHVALYIALVVAALWIAAAAHAQRLITTDSGRAIPGTFDNTVASGDIGGGGNLNTTGGATIQRTTGFAREDRDTAKVP